MAVPVLEVDGLKTHFFTRAGVVKAVDGVSLSLAEGEILGLVGESGSGKSVTGFSILGLVDPPGKIVEGAIRLGGRDLAGLSETELQGVRGRDLAMIFQDPMMTLNPVLKISTQMVETVRAHERVSEVAARARAVETLAMVGIPAPEERLDAYPHQFSGGMRQRVAIAIALLHRPRVIIADEPTTALDVSVQAQVLALMTGMVREHRMGVLLITHNLGVVAQTCSHVAVMYAGNIVESGRVGDVLRRPAHPYTRALLAAIPTRHVARGALAGLAGQVPNLINPPPGCRFAPRCALAVPACKAALPPAVSVGVGHAAACIRAVPDGEVAEC